VTAKPRLDRRFKLAVLSRPMLLLVASDIGERSIAGWSPLVPHLPCPCACASHAYEKTPGNLNRAAADRSGEG
jgi:hypothetical protein